MTKRAQLADGTVLEFPDDTSDAVMDRTVRLHVTGMEPKTQAKPSTVEKKPLPANAGVANFASTALGLPVDTAERAVNLVRAVQGGAAGLAGATDWMPPMLQGTPGGSQWLKERLRATGQPGLSPDNPDPSKMGQRQYDFVSRGGFIPGLALPAAGSIIAEETAGPEWAGVGAMAPAAALTAYNAARAPSLARQESQNAVRDKTLVDARKEGYVVPPSSSGGGFLSRRLESVGGKAAIGQEAAAKNQKVTNDLARREIGLPKDAPITQEALDGLRHKYAAPYREVAKVSPTAAKALEKLQETRLESKLAWQEYGRQGSRAAYKEAKAFDANAEVLEKVIGREAMKAGNPGLLAELRDARKAIAKVHDVDRALNAATGDVSAKVLGRAFDKGKPISGGLKTAGKFAEAFPAYAREGATIPTPGVSKSEAILALMLGTGGAAALGPLGAAAGALPLASGPTRSMLLSGPYQNRVMPSYAPAMSSPQAGPLLLQQLGILGQ